MIPIATVYAVWRKIYTKTMHHTAMTAKMLSHISGWEERDKNMKAHFNFYFDIVHSKISQKSVLLYVLIILITAVAGSALYDLIKNIITVLH